MKVIKELKTLFRETHVKLQIMNETHTPVDYVMSLRIFPQITLIVNSMVNQFERMTEWFLTRLSCKTRHDLKDFLCKSEKLVFESTEMSKVHVDSVESISDQRTVEWTRRGVEEEGRRVTRETKLLLSLSFKWRSDILSLHVEDDEHKQDLPTFSAGDVMTKTTQVIWGQVKRLT